MEPAETDWYDNESWADLELATAGTVRGLYPKDPQWGAGGPATRS